MGLTFLIKTKYRIMAKKLNITPLHDRVIVKPAAAEEKSAGGRANLNRSRANLMGGVSNVFISQEMISTRITTNVS